MKYIIDTPTPFDPVSAWEDFLLLLEALDQSEPEVKSAKAEAQKAIKELRARVAR